MIIAIIRGIIIGIICGIIGAKIAMWEDKMKK